MERKDDARERSKEERGREGRKIRNQTDKKVEMIEKRKREDKGKKKLNIDDNRVVRDIQCLISAARAGREYRSGRKKKEASARRRDLLRCEKKRHYL